jgi:hypothetical protein
MRFLYPYLATPEGLAQWFADKVKASGDAYTFFWDGTPTQAKLIETKQYKSVRFLLENEDFFEIKMREAEISQDTIMIINDCTEDSTPEDINRMWNSAIERLRSIIGA